MRWGRASGRDPEVSELPFPLPEVFIFTHSTGRRSELPSSLHYDVFLTLPQGLCIIYPSRLRSPSFLGMFSDGITD